MAIRTHVLVVANQTLEHPDLIAALKERSGRQPIHVTLLAPVAWAERESAQQRVDATLAKLREADIPGEGMLGDQDPMVAVQEAWDPKRMDEVLVSTLAAQHSRWIRSDLPQRIARYIDCPVRHLETSEPREREAQPLPAKPRQPLLVGFLSNMHAETRREAEEPSS
jgi:hypothetical protein